MIGIKLLFPSNNTFSFNLTSLLHWKKINQQIENSNIETQLCNRDTTMHAYEHHCFPPFIQSCHGIACVFLREIISYNPTNVYGNPHSTIHEENLISSFPRNMTNLDFGDSFATDPPHYYPLVFVPLEFYQQLHLNPISYQHQYHNKPMQCSKAYISLPHYFY